MTSTIGSLKMDCRSIRKSLKPYSRARLRHEQPISSISIAGSDDDIRDSVKSLGVTIDSGLTFNEHVNYICKTSAYHMQDIGISHQVASSHPEFHRQRCGHVRCYRSGRGTCRLLQQSVVRYIETQHRQTSASSELSCSCSHVHWCIRTHNTCVEKAALVADHCPNPLQDCTTHTQSDVHPAACISSCSVTTKSADKNTTTCISPNIGQ